MPTSTLVQHIRKSLLLRDADGQLLDRYVQSRDEAAFEALVRRHGPMVLGVCRRILENEQEAEDAFQATFMVLVKKATSVVPSNMVGNFLHGVARQTAVRARSAATRRQVHERQVENLPETPARSDEPSDDLREILDREVARLPGQFRAAVVSCDLEGRGHKEAALHLGWPVGTLASRLSRGRTMLAKRLARQGVEPSGVGLAAELSRGVPASLMSSTVKAGILYGAGQVTVHTTVVALTKGVLKAMSMNKLKTVVGTMLMAVVIVLGGGLAYRHAAAGQPTVQSESPVALISETGKKGQPAIAPSKKERKDRLEIVADGKKVRVWLTGDNEEFLAVANRMTYDEDGQRLVLEGDVRVRQRRQGKEVQEIQGGRMVIDRKSGKMSVEGAGKIGLAVPVLGPNPIALDLGFPIAKDLHEQQQVFSFFLGFTR
jgi:RNA polymerase sigma factor (sigma-70 family)